MTPAPLRRTAALVAVLALGATVGGCSTSEDSATGSKGYIAGDGEFVIVDAADRVAAPALSGPAVGGGDVDTGDFAGAPYVINVWAHWCGPCRAEADDLVRASERMPRVAFMGINTRDNQTSAEAFVRAEGIPYESLVDEDGSELLKFYGLFNLKTLPTTLVVDAEGRIAALITGPITETTLVDVVDEATAEA